MEEHLFLTKAVRIEDVLLAGFLTAANALLHVEVCWAHTSIIQRRRALNTHTRVVRNKHGFQKTRVGELNCR